MAEKLVPVYFIHELEGGEGMEREREILRDIELPGGCRIWG